MPNENASVPVEEVGGKQSTGPWPEDVEEIVAGEQYDREVPDGDGGTKVVTVEVQEAGELASKSGETAGRVVSYTYTNETGG